jgi:NAD-dependent deacetylase
MRFIAVRQWCSAYTIMGLEFVFVGSPEFCLSELIRVWSCGKPRCLRAAKSLLTWFRTCAIRVNLRCMKVVVLTGAGISAESGISTFRDANGLWENHRIEDVATPEAWERNPELVLRFYNQRRRQLRDVQPNAAHLALAQLEQKVNTRIFTQNVDDLHERAGSKNILHLHGELMYARSTQYPELRYRLENYVLETGDTCERGAQLRPDIVWFGEPVPMIELAMREMLTADAVFVVGTSLEVYPAAGLLDFAPADSPVWVVDPNRHARMSNARVRVIQEPATTGVPKAIEQLFVFMS